MNQVWTGIAVVNCLLFAILLPGREASAVDADLFKVSKETPDPDSYEYVLQVFVQRPSIKILFGKDDDVDPQEEREVFDGMNYEAESMNAAGLKVSWKNFGIMASRRIGSSDHLTTQKFEDYQLVHYTDLFGLNLRYQHYAGMIQLMNFKGPKVSDDSTYPRSQNRSEYIKRPESSVTHRSFAMQYLIFGRDFTLASAFGEGSPIVRRGYGFPLFIAATKTEFDTGEYLVDDRYAFFFNETSSLERITTENAYIGGGAAGTLPFGKFFVSSHASIGLGGQKMQQTYSHKTKSSYDSAAKADLRFVLGWNIRQGFANLTYDLEGTTFRIGEIHATVQSDMISAAAGVRL